MKEILYKNNIFIIFSIFFLLLMIGNYYLNRSFVKEVLTNEQFSILKNSSDKIQEWLENKKTSLKFISLLVSDFDHTKEQNAIQDILIKSQQIANFSSTYVGYENNTMLSSRVFQGPKNYIPTQRPWYINTVLQNGIYITKPYLDAGLKIPVISICQNIKRKNELQGVICGVISFESIKNEILNLRLENGYIFLIDEDLNILLHPDSKTEFFQTKFNIENLDLIKSLSHETQNEILNFKPLENSKLILVTKTLKDNIYNEINEQFMINLIIYAISIILFLILAYFYNKRLERQSKIFEKAKRDYEVLLFQQTKMAELGQMIAALSHQWIQPLNSLGIFLGNLMQFKKMNKLSDEIFYDNITRSLQNIDYMSKTMDMFKNFYKIEKNVQEFNILKAINDTICVLFPVKSTIDIKVTVAKGVIPMCKNYINEFKQITACLIQNSKQILQNSKNKKRTRIVVNIKQTQTHFIIRVIDNGDGIAQNFKDNVFTPFMSTKGSSGLGLYISKLIANKKCGGDLYVSRYKNPTIFTLTILKKVRDDR
ncbi:sensor histidine kinase [Campylobacter fetus]|uniref:sensor histidine kinase n=1 Tax=Campylobacter fetus TaxID=196 RepID=UPI0008188380|nr:sensor histidine kinase [Campylobacter fetus]OCR94338.1 histidine kinase [Campylobacter fetus subsp. testudinum]